MFSQAMHAEAIALKQALLLAEQRGIGRIILASDCKNLITAITSNSYDSANLGQLFLEIKYMLSLSFIQYRVEFCPRSINLVAHLLAQKGAGEGHGFHAMWEVCYPDVYFVSWQVTQLSLNGIRVFHYKKTNIILLS